MDARPDPDQLLNQIQREDPQDAHGKLKIMLGYAAGVGKTYAMLAAAQQLRVDGVDVVVAYVETHGRPETDALLAGLEIIPRQAIAYRGITLSEMDTDAVLRRRPQVALVDELAHTNAPGSRHRRRYQDVLELLDSGINVYTTMNVQHLESLNDVVAQVTGVTVQETVPDRVLDEAHEIELIDLPINELLARLEAGKVYVPAQAERALRKFFRPGNLTALREMALRRAADRVDEQMRAYMQTHAITGPWPAGERLLVCVGPSPLSERLVRTTRRLARRLDAEWIAAYVETTGSGDLPEAEQARVAQTLRLAEGLGAQAVRLSGDSVAEAVVEYALSRNVTKIVAGKPLRPRWRDLLRGSIIDQILERSQDLDVYVISGKADAEQPVTGRRRPPARAIHWRPYLLSTGLVLLATVLGLPFRPFINSTNLVMLYLAAVVVSALRLGRRPAILAALLSVLVFDIAFVPPYGTIAVEQAEYLLTFAGLLAVGLVISSLAARAQEQTRAARRREAQTAALYELSKRLASVSSPLDIARTVVSHVHSTFAAPAAILLPDEVVAPLRPADDPGNHGHLAVRAGTVDFELEPEGPAVADWVYRHGQPAGRFTDTLSAVAGHYLPLLSAEQTVGVLCVEFPADQRGGLGSDQRNLLLSFAGRTALALERTYLAEQARRTRLLEETEKLQTALLNSISHDLRTPLASITGALSSLLDDADLLTEDARQELLRNAWEEALRLNRLVGNLLDMARLESGAMKVARRPYDVQELVGAILAQMPARLRGRKVERRIPADLPPVDIDMTLMVQALMNLVDNALKYSSPDMPVEIEAYLEQGMVLIAVMDRGPGVPEGELEHVFDKFFRLERGRVGGTGLGLSIARGIVEAHGGRIWAGNREGGGAVFTLALPADQDSTFKR